MEELSKDIIIEDAHKLDAIQFLGKYFGDKRLSVMDYKDCCNYNNGFVHLYFFGIGDVIYFNGTLKELKLMN